MYNSNTRSKTIKKKLSKCKNIFYAHSNLQFEYGNNLDLNDDIVEIKCNVKLIGCELGDSYTSDFVCIKRSGETMVRECVEKSKLIKPLTCKMLDSSRNYWLSKGVDDWGIVLNDS